MARVSGIGLLRHCIFTAKSSLDVDLGGEFGLARDVVVDDAGLLDLDAAWHI